MRLLFTGFHLSQQEEDGHQRVARMVWQHSAVWAWRTGFYPPTAHHPLVMLPQPLGQTSQWSLISYSFSRCPWQVSSALSCFLINVCQAAWTKVQNISLTLISVAQCPILWQILPVCLKVVPTEKKNHLMLYSVPQVALACKLQWFHPSTNSDAHLQVNSVLPFRHYNLVVVAFRRPWLGNQCCSTLHSGLVRHEEESPW